MRVLGGSGKMTPAYKRGMNALRMKTNLRPLDVKFRRLARKSPAMARRAARKAAVWMADQSFLVTPVSSRPGGGKTALRTKAFVRTARGGVEGGVRVNVPWAVWLMAGTRAIAGGRLLTWDHGAPTIKMWPAKADGVNPAAELPIVLPFLMPGRDRMMDEMRKELRNAR